MADKKKKRMPYIDGYTRLEQGNWERIDLLPDYPTTLTVGWKRAFTLRFIALNPSLEFVRSNIPGERGYTFWRYKPGTEKVPLKIPGHGVTDTKPTVDSELNYPTLLNMAITRIENLEAEITRLTTELTEANERASQFERLLNQVPTQLDVRARRALRLNGK